MKKLIYLMFGYFAWCIFIYLLGSFVRAELNPFLWSVENRRGMVYFSFVYFAIVLVYELINQSKQNQ